MSKFRTLLLGGAAVAVAAGVLLKRKEIAGLLEAQPRSRPAAAGRRPRPPLRRDPPTTTSRARWPTPRRTSRRRIRS